MLRAVCASKYNTFTYVAGWGSAEPQRCERSGGPGAEQRCHSAPLPLSRVRWALPVASVRSVSHAIKYNPATRRAYSENRERKARADPDVFFAAPRGDVRQSHRTVTPTRPPHRWHQGKLTHYDTTVTDSSHTTHDSHATATSDMRYTWGARHIALCKPFAAEGPKVAALF